MSVERSTSTPATTHLASRDPRLGHPPRSHRIHRLSSGSAALRLPSASPGCSSALAPFCGLVFLYQGMAERFCYIASIGAAIAVVSLIASTRSSAANHPPGCHRSLGRMGNLPSRDPPLRLELSRHALPQLARGHPRQPHPLVQSRLHPPRIQRTPRRRRRLQERHPPEPHAMNAPTPASARPTPAWAVSTTPDRLPAGPRARPQRRRHHPQPRRRPPPVQPRRRGRAHLPPRHRSRPQRLRRLHRPRRPPLPAGPDIEEAELMFLNAIDRNPPTPLPTPTSRFSTRTQATPPSPSRSTRSSSRSAPTTPRSSPTSSISSNRTDPLVTRDQSAGSSLHPPAGSSSYPHQSLRSSF